MGLIHTDSYVGKFFVCEIRARVALGTFAFLVEKIETVLLSFRERGLVSTEKRS
jgi:hypothetical protein